jgi:hypothetical protein
MGFPCPVCLCWGGCFPFYPKFNWQFQSILTHTQSIYGFAYFDPNLLECILHVSLGHHSKCPSRLFGQEIFHSRIEGLSLFNLLYLPAQFTDIDISCST